MGLSNEDLQQMVASLKQQRDELNLKLHLAKADGRDEWAKLETQWEEVRTKLDITCKEASHTAGAVASALELALDEIKKGYERIRRSL